MSVETLLQKVKEIVQKPILRGVIGGLVMAVSLGYLGSVLARNWQELMTYDWQIDYGQAVLAFIYYSAALAFAILGWNLIMSRLTQVKNLRNLPYPI